MSSDDKTPVEPSIEVTGTGPNLVRGIRTIKLPDGTVEVVPDGRPVALCACGKTATPPYCSGAHKNG